MSAWKRFWGWAGVVALPVALLYVYRTDIDAWLGVHGWQLARFLFWSALVWWSLWGLATVINSRYEPRTAWERESRRPPKVSPPPPRR